MSHLTDRRQIINWLDAQHIIDFTLHGDGTVDTGDSVDLGDRDLSEIPIKFGTVNGYFSVLNNHLTSLENCPDVVQGHYDCRNNLLTTLQHLPSRINDELYCTGNNFKSHLLGAILVDELTEINIHPVRLYNILNKHLKTKDIFACQQDLIDAGYEEYAQL